MTQHHSGQFLEERLRDLVLSSQQQRNPTLDKCPVCSLRELTWRNAKTNDPNYEVNASSFLEHIGVCLHTFSLRALPVPEYDEDDAISSGAFAARSSISDLSDILSDTLTAEQDSSGSPGLTEADLQRAFNDTLSTKDKVSAWNSEAASESFSTTPVNNFPCSE